MTGNTDHGKKWKGHIKPDDYPIYPIGVALSTGHSGNRHTPNCTKDNTCCCIYPVAIDTLIFFVDQGLIGAMAQLNNAHTIACRAFFGMSFYHCSARWALVMRHDLQALPAMSLFASSHSSKVNRLHVQDAGLDTPIQKLNTSFLYLLLPRSARDLGSCVLILMKRNLLSNPGCPPFIHACQALYMSGLLN